MAVERRVREQLRRERREEGQRAGDGRDRQPRPVRRAGRRDHARIACARKSIAGPIARNRSCSRTVPIRPAHSPSAIAPPSGPALRARGSTPRRTATRRTPTSRGQIRARDTRRTAAACRPRREARAEPVSDHAPRDQRRQQHGEKRVARGSVGDRRDVRPAEAVGGRAGRVRDDVADRVEGRPQQRRSRRPVVDAAPGLVRPLEKRLVELHAARHAGIVEMLVLVLEVRRRDRTRSIAATRSTRFRPTRTAALSRPAARSTNTRHSRTISRRVSIGSHASREGRAACIGSSIVLHVLQLFMLPCSWRAASEK